MEFLTRSASVRDRIRIWRAADTRGRPRALESLTAAGFAPEYLVIRQGADLGAIREGTRDLVILAAARLGSTRLRDNLRVHLIDRH
jgi:pantoate--beta-alanine ligase